MFVALVTGAFCQADGSNVKNTEGGEGGGKKKKGKERMVNLGSTLCAIPGESS